MKVTLFALVVVYGCRAEDTASLQTLLRCPRNGCELRVLVWDNSPVPQPLAPDLAQAVHFVSTPENLGLPIIYNRVASQWLKPGEYLLLLDQDSVLPPEFLDRAAAAISAHRDIDLFLPIVDAGGRQASPLTYVMGWGRTWKQRVTGRMPARNVCAINSGMLIAGRYLADSAPAYDEQLRFYGTDTQFMLDYADRRTHLVVFDAVIEHDLSFFSGPASQRARKFADMRRALLHVYARRSAVQRYIVALVMLAAALRYAVKYQDLGFIRGSAR